MQTHSTTPSPKQARAAAQIAYLKGIESLKKCGRLTEADRSFLYSQRPSGIDAEGRIVLEFASAADVAAAGSSPDLNRIARQLRGEQLATGLGPLGGRLVPGHLEELLARHASDQQGKTGIARKPTSTINAMITRTCGLRVWREG